MKLKKLPQVVLALFTGLGLGCGSDAEREAGFTHYGLQYRCERNAENSSMTMTGKEMPELAVGWRQPDEHSITTYLFREYHTGNLYRKTGDVLQFIGNTKAGRDEEEPIADRDRLLDILYVAPMGKCEDILE